MQHDAFRQQDVQSVEVLHCHKALPVRYGNIRDASQKLHEALCRYWCCEDAAHRGHCAKLCITTEAETEDEVQLDLAISCQEPALPGVSQYVSKQIPFTFTDAYARSLSEPPVWLYVQSRSVTASHDMPGTPSDALLRLKSSLPAEYESCSLATASGIKASADSAQQSPCRKRIKRVHFVDPAPVTYAQPIDSATTTAVYVEPNLCQEKDICRYLRQNSSSMNQSHPKHCVGYLETPQFYKHMFYLRQMQSVASRTRESNAVTVYSLFDIMRTKADDVFSIEDQLKLAYKTALAILQYNNTPWLRERWRLQDLKYFGSDDSFDDSAFKSLHLSSQISALTGPACTDMEGVQTSTEAIKDEVHFGINNVTLFFLGVALLEIAHWKPIEDQMRPVDRDNQIFAARRIASSRPSSLGSEYQRIAEKCLQCNFGFGTKLESKRLQTAVYNDVVCGLERLMLKEIDS